VIPEGNETRHLEEFFYKRRVANHIPKSKKSAVQKPSKNGSMCYFLNLVIFHSWLGFPSYLFAYLGYQVAKAEVMVWEANNQ